MNHYRVLGVSREANLKDIKTQYRRLALLHHPDRGGKSDRFALISSAYEILSDPQARTRYDATLSPLSNKAPLYSGSKSSAPEGFSKSSIDPLLNMMTRQELNLHHSLKIPLSELYTGTRKQIRVHRTIIRGTSRISEERILAVQIHPGTPDHHQMVIEGYGNQKDEINGNLILTILEVNQSKFQRSKDDLRLTLSISLKESLIGFEKSITHLDGRIITIKRLNVTPNGAEIKLNGEGMKSSIPDLKKEKVGNLVIKIRIEYPDQLSDQIIEYLKTHM